MRLLIHDANILIDLLDLGLLDGSVPSSGVKSPRAGVPYAILLVGSASGPSTLAKLS